MDADRLVSEPIKKRPPGCIAYLPGAKPPKSNRSIYSVHSQEFKASFCPSRSRLTVIFTHAVPIQHKACTDTFTRMLTNIRFEPLICGGVVMICLTAVRHVEYSVYSLLKWAECFKPRLWDNYKAQSSCVVLLS
jgi:hypothetical protein